MDFPNKSDEGKEDWALSDNAAGSSSAADGKKVSGGDHDSQNHPKGVFHTCLSTVALGATFKEDDTTEQSQSGASGQKDGSVVCLTESLMNINREQASTSVQTTCAKSPDVLRRETHPSASQEFNPRTFLGSNDERGKPCTNAQIGMRRRIISESHALPAFYKTCLPEVTRSAPLNVSDHLPVQPDTSRASTDAQGEDAHPETTKKAFPVVLDMQQQERSAARSPDVLRGSQAAELLGAQLPEETPGLFTGSVSPESDQAGLRSCDMAAQSDAFKDKTQALEHKTHDGSPYEVSTTVLELQEWDTKPSGTMEPGRPDAFRRGAELSVTRLAEMSNAQFPEKKFRLSPTLSSSKSNERVLKSLCLSSESNISVMGFCQREEEAESSALCAVEESKPCGDASNEALKNSAARERLTAADAEQDTGVAGEAAEQRGAERTDGKHRKAPSEQTRASTLNEEDEPEHHGGHKVTVKALEQVRSCSVVV